MQEPLIENFFSNKHNGSHKDIKVQIIDYCDPNNPERREDFWIYHLDTIFPRENWYYDSDYCLMNYVLCYEFWR